jgi:CheY-like chemotaxis protein
VRDVLVVDDDADFLEMVTFVLSGEGYRVTGARNGEEALRILSAGLRPCLILMDLMMPDMNGWTLRSRLAEDPSLASIPIAVLSGNHQALRANAPAGVLLLQKPVSLATLLSVVRNCEVNAE